MRARIVFKGLALIGSLAVLGSLFKFSDLGSGLTPAWIDIHVRGHGLSGELLFMLAGGLLTAIGLPRQIVSFLGGYAFGVALGTLLGAAATLFGCILSFAYARYLGRAFLRAKFGEQAMRLDRFVHDHPLALTVLVRLLPVGNNLATNLAAGISAIRPAPFLAGSFLGYLPQTLVFALVGSGVHIAPVEKLAVAIALFLVSAALGAYLYHRFRHGLSLDDRIDAELEESAPGFRETASRS